ncbi:MAG TPA: hypothetical protein VNB49_10525 [Candidatus Dormibacteraeota bacterium]|nr:hypothetical protein [Candidatus Dormibacteraeota bacterium]
MERRIGNVERKLDWIDEHGTRGIQSLTTMISVLQRDFGKLEGEFTKMDNAIDRLTDRLGKTGRSSWTVMVGYALTLIPIYVLVITLIVKR